MTNPLRITRLAFQESTTSLMLEEIASPLRATAQLFVLVAAYILVMELSVDTVRATTLTWTNGSGDFNTAANWDPAQAPAGGDTTVFTNDTVYTVTLAANSPAMFSSTISNHAGVVTFNPNGFTWQVTNHFRVGVMDSTTTVYVAGGTLAAAGITATTGQLRIGDSASLFNCVATMIVTNGTVATDAGIIGASATAVGTLIITGNGVYRDGGTGSGSTLAVGSPSAGNRLIVTNGGKLFVDGTLTVGNNLASSNNFMLISDPTSAATITAAGDVQFSGSSGRLIVSNGAKLFMTGSLLFGGASSANTGIVVGAGSAVIAQGAFQVGLGSAGGTNNYFLVSDGGFISSGGTFAFGNGAFHINDGIQIGGTGLMSTAVFTVVRSASNNTNHFGNFMTVTNAFVTCNYLNPQGPGETVSVLSKGTWIVTNSISIAVPASNSNSISMNGFSSTLLIDGGTINNLLTADNVGGMNYGGTGGNSLIITNGGKLLTSRGTLGSGTSLNTGVVVGSGSVWSNFSGVANFTNILIVGTGAGGNNNFFSVSDGATLYNNGTFNIGNNLTASVNYVRIGGVGLPSTVVNSGSLNIGSATGSYSNTLVVTNATLTVDTVNVGNSGATNNLLDFEAGTISVGFVRVRPTNTVVFNSGTLSVGGLTFDTLANNSNAFLVGDGTSAAFYDMAAGGDGYHNFNNGGLVVTNGASLRGSGTIVGNATVLGTFTPGFSVGSVFCSNNLVFGNSATLSYDLGTLSSDSVTVKGDLVLGGTINVLSSGSFGASTYVLFTHTNTVSGTLTVGTMPGGFTATVSTNTLPLVQLIVSPVATGPDYATWLSHYGLSGGGALGTADPDNDGMNNTNEFLAGFNPTNNAAYVRVISVAKSTTNIVVTYLGASGDSTYANGPASRTNVLEFTTSVPGTGSYSNNFASIGAGGTNILSGGTGLGTVTSFVDTNGASSGTKYYRVRVLVP